MQSRIFSSSCKEFHWKIHYRFTGSWVCCCSVISWHHVNCWCYVCQIRHGGMIMNHETQGMWFILRCYSRTLLEEQGKITNNLRQNSWFLVSVWIGYLLKAGCMLLLDEMNLVADVFDRGVTRWYVLIWKLTPTDVLFMCESSWPLHT